MGGDVKAISNEENTICFTYKHYIELNHTYDKFGRKSIHTAAIQDQNNAVEKIKALVQNGVDINARELRTGNNLLHIAVKTRNYRLAEWLCRQPIQKEAVNFNYETAYRIAFKARDLRMMQLLRLNDAAYVNLMVDRLSDESS